MLGNSLCVRAMQIQHEKAFTPKMVWEPQDNCWLLGALIAG